MAQNRRRTSSGRSILAVLAGGAIAAAVDSAENYGFVHFLPHGWEYVSSSYILVGLVTAAPTMFIRPGGPAIELLTGAVSVFAFVAGDLGYVFASSLRHGPSFDLLDYLLSYGEFQSPYTVSLESLAPLAALLLCRLRLVQSRGLRVAARLRIATRLPVTTLLPVTARPRGRHAGPVASEYQVPAPARPVDRPHHADID